MQVSRWNTQHELLEVECQTGGQYTPTQLAKVTACPFSKNCRMPPWLSFFVVHLLSVFIVFLPIVRFLSL